MRDWNSLAHFTKNARKISKPLSTFRCPLPTSSNTEETSKRTQTWTHRVFRAQQWTAPPRDRSSVTTVHFNTWVAHMSLNEFWVERQSKKKKIETLWAEGLKMKMEMKQN